MTLTEIGLVLPWGLVAAGLGLAYVLVRQYGRILLRLEAVEGKLVAALGRPAGSAPPSAPPPPELAAGTEAPEFDLPDLDGRRRTLAEFRGRRVLLIFFNPHCGFCTRMADGLAALPPDGAAGGPIPVVVSTGPVEDNRELALAHGFQMPMFLQTQMEVAARYAATSTPMGYLIDADGRIASPRLVGAESLLGRAVPPTQPTPPTSPTPAAEAKCPKCNGTTKGCGKCARSAEPTMSAPTAGESEYDFVRFTADAPVTARIAELTQRAAGCKRLIVPAGLDGTAEATTIALRRFLTRQPDWLVAHQAAGGDGFVVLSRDPRDRKPLPSVFRMAAGFAKALAVHIGDGGRRVTPDQLEARLSLCTLCDRRVGDRCSACGCDVAVKAGWRTSKCPLGKWPEANAQPQAV